jgi:hypothetical protein
LLDRTNAHPQGHNDRCFCAGWRLATAFEQKHLPELPEAGLGFRSMTDREIDPIIVEYVEHTANRFGVRGLEDMIALAEEQLVAARAALLELGDLDS